MRRTSVKRTLAFFIACLMVVSTCLTVTIGASDYDELVNEWDYLDEGTGMPDPNDPTEGLPFPNLEGIDPLIKDYYFTYKPTVFAYGEDGNVDMSSPVSSVKAGDVFWFKLACTDIEVDKLTDYEGFYQFQGFYSYDVENIKRFYGDRLVSHARPADGTPFIADKNWLDKYIHVSTIEGMIDDISWNVDWGHVIDSTNPPKEWLQTYISGYGQHFSIAIDNSIVYGDVGIIEDDQFYICVPLVVNEDAVEGDEFTFTVPYPALDEFALAYFWYQSNDGNMYIDHDEMYARGGSYTITIDNHDEIGANLATNATYSVATVGNPLVSYDKGYLNDQRYPLTEKSDYIVAETSINGGAIVDLRVDVLSEVDEIVVTFNDTDATELPAKVEVFGIDANNNSVYLGEATSGVAYDSGITDSTNYAKEVTVNAANAYQYTVSDFEPDNYMGIFFRIYGAEGDEGYEDVAIGEIEVFGGVAKVSVTIENGVITNASADNLYTPGDVLYIEADEIAHKLFAEWIAENGSGEFSADGTTFTVGNVDEVITATYDDVYYPLVVENGHLDDNQNETEVLFGTELNIYAEQPGNNQIFDKWVVDGDAVVADPTDPNTTVTVNGEATVTATYMDTCILAVTNGSGDGNYTPGTNAEVSADAPADGYLFYCWEVVSGNVVIADAKAENTTVTVNSNAEIKAVYVWTYKDVPNNLVNKDTNVTLVQGSAVSGSADYTKDQLYPLLPECDWLIATDDTSVILSYDLEGVYDISEVVINTAKLDGFVYADTVVIYGANSADLSDKQVIATMSVSELDETFSFDAGIELTANSGILKVPVNNDDGYRYIAVELSTDYNFSHPSIGTFKNSEIAVGEIEIYGNVSRYQVDVIGGTSYCDPDYYNDEGYLAGAVIELTPDSTDGSGEYEFEKWVASLGDVTFEGGKYIYVVSGDATVTAVNTEINQPVPDNLAPGSDVTLASGTLDTDAATGAYINDQLYPITANAYWATYAPSADKEISFVFDLGDYYDISSVSLTSQLSSFVNQTLLPQSIKVEGNIQNSFGPTSGAVTLGSLNGCVEESTYSVLQFADFGVDSSLESLACKYDISVTDTVACRYVKVTVGANYIPLMYQYYPNPKVVLGEIEIYGEESEFQVSIVGGTIETPSDDGLYNNGESIIISAPEVEHMVFSGWTVEGEGTFANELDANTSFIVGGSDATITANYVDRLYGLTVNNGTGSGDYAFGSSVEINADAHSDPEKIFDKWVVVSGDAVIADATNPQTTVTTGVDSVVEATYKDRVYLLTVENGTGSGDYSNGTRVSVTADSPAAHKVFSHWEIVSGSCVIESDNAETTVVVTSNVPTTIRAIYSDVYYGLEVEDGTGGGEYIHGTSVNISANENNDPEKIFDKWVVVSGDAVITDANSANTTVTTGTDSVIKATYKDKVYALTVENGSGDGDYAMNSTVQVVADAPATHKIFSHWEIVSGTCTIDDVNSATATVTTSNEATVIRAVYDDVLYNVTVNNGSISEEDVEDAYKVGTELDIIADEASEHMQFDRWVVTEGECLITDPTNSETTITVNGGNLVIEATYTDVQYSLTVNGGSGDGLYTVNDEITVAVDDLDRNSVFNSWLVESGDVAIVSDNGDSMVIKISSDAVITAVLDSVYFVEVINGTVDADDSKESYDGTETITIIADPAEAGMKFNGWVIVEGEGEIEDASAESTTVTLNSTDLVIRAEYVDDAYTLTVVNGKDSGNFVTGSVVTISANVPEGYIFTGWSVTEGSIEIDDASAVQTNVIIVGNATVVATYEAAVGVDVINGSVDEDDVKDYYINGDSVVIIADEAPEGMRFDGWVIVEGDGELEDADAPSTTLTFGSENVVVRAEYTDIFYSVDVEKGEIENEKPEGYVNGTVITVNADAAPEGYEFDKWVVVSGEGEFADEYSENTTFTVGCDNTVIRATYKVVSNTPDTGDSGIVAFAVLAILSACTGAVVLKKKSK